MPAYYYGTGATDYVILTSDPEYLGGIYNEKKFTRLTDTIYFAFDNGISKAYNYDFFDTITPFNTTNMPSGNVLEMEFDENDTLWAVFGDGSDVPFAIAKLDGTTWTNEINAGNSPIDFSNFYGFEMDTLGNMWFVDNAALHTIVTQDSPGWLGLDEKHLESMIGVFPNPTNSSISIELPTSANNPIRIIDLSGNLIKEFETDQVSFQIDISDLANGVYLIYFNINDTQIVKRIIVQK
jgi:hypothetical protein